MAMAGLVVLLCFSLLLTTVAAVRLQLRHIDAMHNLTAVDRLRRAADRAHRLLSSAHGAQMPVFLSDLAYVAEYGIGSPPQRVQSAVDTASSLVWTQCSTCDPCFEQEIPRFDLARSRTGATVPCNNHTLCIAESTVTTGCAPGDGRSCGVRLGDTDISGTLDVDNFLFEENRVVSIAFGCVTSADQPETDRLDGASGVLGLGRGPLSLVSQIGGSRFSYCLTPFFSRGDDSVTSPLFVGSSARLTGDAPITSVPLILEPEQGRATEYYVPMVGLSVGVVRLDLPDTAFTIRYVEPGVWAGGVVIDSRVPFMLLVDVAYSDLRKEVSRQMAGRLVPPPSGAAYDDGLDLCVLPEDVDWVPTLTLHFRGGEELLLPAINYWLDEDQALCMAVRSSADENQMLPMNETSYIGSIMQQNLHVLYDYSLGDGYGTVSFQPEDCTNL